MELEETVQTGKECFICGGAQWRAAAPVAAADGVSRLAPDGHKHWLRCEGCGLYTADPLPDCGDIAAYLDEKLERRIRDDRDDFSRTVFRIFTEELTQSHRRLRTIENRARGGRLLDVGAGWGVFVGAAQERGWDALGIDLCLYAAQLVREIFKIELKQGAFEEADFPSAHFDVITMWEYLEHAIDPAAALQKAAHILKPGGLLALSSPNTESLFNRSAFNRGEGQWDTPDHFHLFSRTNIEQLLRANNFEPIEFDVGAPFYWSMDMVAVKRL